jgi:hypothetical protein
MVKDNTAPAIHVSLRFRRLAVSYLRHVHAPAAHFSASVSTIAGLACWLSATLVADATGVGGFDVPALAASAAPCGGMGDEQGWTDLLAEGLSAWKTPRGDWLEVAEVELDPQSPRKFVTRAGTGVFFNGKAGKNLFTKQKYADVELHLEFNLPKGSNSGVKFHGHYEVQLYDSFGKKEVTGEDCGGIYPRAEAKPRYHHIDRGIPPRVNACKPPGQWQTLEVVFQAPRFDAAGKKVKNARIARAVLNSQLIHENQELLTPTGDRWQNAEMAEGPLMLQADHGPVAFRNARLRPVRSDAQ